MVDEEGRWRHAVAARDDEEPAGRDETEDDERGWEEGHQACDGSAISGESSWTLTSYVLVTSKQCFESERGGVGIVELSRPPFVSKQADLG